MDIQTLPAKELKARDLKLARNCVTKYAPEGSRIRGIVTSVSRSGMSRRIQFFTGHVRADGTADTVNLTWAFHILTGWPMNDLGLKVDGCGMDMVFHTIYTVSREVYGDGYALKQS